MKVIKISGQAELDQAFAIRRKVFVEEQQVSAEDEYDEFEDSAVHFLVLNSGGKACGTARWRFTGKGIKLERFAVLAECRGSGAGSALVQAVLDDIEKAGNRAGKVLYLHAQLPAVPLYSRFGFRPEGEQFEECGIMHYKMIKK